MLLVIAYLNAFVELQRERTAIEPTSHLVLNFPDSEIARAAALNYTTALADLMWIALLVNFGENRRLGVRVPENLLDNAMAVAQVDPLMYKVYDWAPAAYLNNLGQVHEADIIAANEILRFGMHAYPNSHELPYSAALNYIGYSDGANPARRAREVRRALELLNEVVKRPDAPPSVTGTSAYFMRRLAQLEGDDVDPSEYRARQIDLNLRLLSTVSDPATQRQIVANLRGLGAEDRELVDRIEALGAEEAAAHAADLPYLPRELWFHLADKPPRREMEGG